MLLWLLLVIVAGCDQVPDGRTVQAGPPVVPKFAPTTAVAAPRCLLRTEMDVAYGPDRKQKLDLYLPKRAKGRAPLLVWLHPGGWAGGSRDDVHHWAIGQLCNGFAVASVDYRLSEEVRFPEPVRDVRAAIRLLMSRAERDGTDPDRIALWGASAGGYLAALLGTTSGTTALEAPASEEPPLKLRGVVTWWAPIDFGSMDAPLQARCPGAQCHTCAGSPESRFLGVEVRTHPQAVRKSNPLTYVHRGDTPPFLVMHGSADCTVPVEQAELLANGLRQAGDQVSLSIVQGASHGSGHWARSDVLATVSRFLKGVLLVDKQVSP